MDRSAAPGEARYVIPAPPTVALPVAGEAGLFPVRRVYCVGRNYAEHAREMGHDPDREEPFFFTKPADALATDGRFPYPAATKDVHHEI
jgi:fumarylpyruvate hydrolase